MYLRGASCGLPCGLCPSFAPRMSKQCHNLLREPSTANSAFLGQHLVPPDASRCPPTHSTLELVCTTSRLRGPYRIIT